jgi:maltose alpha-D-glucosyltransferase/alpha-amylase
MLFVQISYNDGFPEYYLLPIIIDTEQEMAEDDKSIIIGNFHLDGQKYYILEAVASPAFREKMMMQFFNGKKQNKSEAEDALEFTSSITADKKLTNEDLAGQSRLIDTRKGNNAIVYKQDYFLKMYRRLDKAPNPDYETVKFLCDHTDFANIPKYKGEITWANGSNFTSVMGLLQEYIPNQGSAKLYFEDVIKRYYERVISIRNLHTADDIKVDMFEPIEDKKQYDWFEEVIGNVVLDRASLLGNLTANLHLSLASKRSVQGFEVEDFSLHYQKSLFSALQSGIRQTLDLSKKTEAGFSEETQEIFAKLQKNKNNIVNALKALQDEKIETLKTRIHGNLHLGNVLFTGKDFYYNDFEGDATRAFSEKRLKKSPLKDIASLIRSFHYAAYHAVFNKGVIRKEDISFVQEWSHKWYIYVSNRFFSTYYSKMESAGILPADKAHTKLLLKAFLVERALYELRIEIAKKSDKALLPAIAINDLISEV